MIIRGGTADLIGFVHADYMKEEKSITGDVELDFYTRSFEYPDGMNCIELHCKKYHLAKPLPGERVIQIVLWYDEPKQ
jgi:hypothetical protein